MPENEQDEAAAAPRAVVRLEDAPARLSERGFVLATAGGVEVRRTWRGEPAVVGYSWVRLLASACGAGHPRTRIAREQLIEFCEQAGVGAVVLDAVPRFPEPEDGCDLPPLTLAEFVEEHGGLDVRAGARWCVGAGAESPTGGAGRCCWPSPVRSCWRPGAGGLLLNPALAEDPGTRARCGTGEYARLPERSARDEDAAGTERGSSFAPGALDAVAGQLRRGEQVLDGVSASAGAESGWHGPAAKAFQESIDQVDTVSDKMADWAARSERGPREFAASLEPRTSSHRSSLTP